MAWAMHLLRPHARHTLTLDAPEPECVPQAFFDRPDVRRREMDWLRTYQGELELRLREIEVDASVLGRAPRVQAAGHPE